MQRLLITFDYEPFFNNGSVEVHRSMIEPTERLLKVLKPSSRNVFFVDGLFLKMLRINGFKSEYAAIKKQLTKIVDLGFEIGLHTHPHWVDSKVDASKVSNNFQRFSLGAFGAKAGKLVESAFHEINQHMEISEIHAFRAGGLLLDGWDDFSETLLKLGVTEDHSIVPDFIGSNAGKQINYSKLSLQQPATLDVFNNQLALAANFIEYPITTFKKTVFMKIRDVYFGRNANILRSKQPIVNGLVGLTVQCNARYLTCDLVHPRMFRSILQKVRRRTYLSFINHPKEFSKMTETNIQMIYENA